MSQHIDDTPNITPFDSVFENPQYKGVTVKKLYVFKWYVTFS